MLILRTVVTDFIDPAGRRQAELKAVLAMLVPATVLLMRKGVT